MKYVSFIWTDGLPVPEALSAMQRELPRWIDDMDRRGVRLLGRELDLPETSATVRVREGEVLVSDGPFAETKEFVAGFDLLDCADLDEAIEAMAASPVARFHPIEIRPLMEGLRLSVQASAFGRGEDGAACPYLLSSWASELPDQTMTGEVAAWREDLERRGVYVLGGALEGPDTATTVRVRGAETLLSDGSPDAAAEFVTGIDVVSCGDRREAIELAAAHPLARHSAIEVRPFYTG
jgi:hypothetical protein